VGRIAQDLDGVKVGVADRIAETDYVTENKLPVGTQDPPKFVQGLRRVGPVVCAVAGDNKIERTVIKRKRFNVSEPGIDVAESARLGQ